MHREMPPVKDWFRRLRPLPLYTVLVVSLAYFLAESAVSYATHALTLLVASYHMLSNVLALVGVVFTLKHGERNSGYERYQKPGTASVSGSGEDLTSPDKKMEIATSQSSKHERRLKNTFGWARVDVVVTTMVCVFLASLCFSLLVEAVQTLVHIDHQDPMHHPIPVLCVGGAGLVVNGLCYLLIGGYTFHQGSYLHMTAAGDVILDRVITGDHPVKRGQRSRTRKPNQNQNAAAAVNQDGKKEEDEKNSSALDVTDKPDKAIVERVGYEMSGAMPRRQGGREMARDIMSSIFVIICSLFVHWTDPDVAKYVDPVISIISCICLLWLSYPYMKESSLILLQTIPASINIDSLRANLLEAFPDIVNVHELHVWQLTANKIVSTAHIVFQNPEDYGRITDEVAQFFSEQGITQATIQPEFSTGGQLDNSDKQRISDFCLMRCPGANACRENHCCGDSEQKQIQDNHEDTTGPYKRTAAKNQEPANLLSIRIEQPHQEKVDKTPSDRTQEQIQVSVRPISTISTNSLTEGKQPLEVATLGVTQNQHLSRSSENFTPSIVLDSLSNKLVQSRSLTNVPQSGC